MSATLEMGISSMAAQLRAGKYPEFPPNANSLGYAESLDAQDSLSHLRDCFILPTKGSLKKRALDGTLPGGSRPLRSGAEGPNVTHGTHGTDGPSCANGHADHTEDATPSIYFVGNSLGAQPKAVRAYLDAQLETWASVGVGGHFTDMANSPLVAWQDMAEDCASKSADLVGASPAEIVIMNSLSANLHLMMASFYRPSGRRHKVLLEWRPFPSDHYVVESQMRWHGLDPGRSMVQIQPDDGFLVSTDTVLAAVDEHADETALLLLPGVQYYSGQLFDMERITRHARGRGIVVGWDLAHAAGNVELRLHDWDVDFACWCTYKYINAGPGAIAAAFVHERHGTVEDADGPPDGPPPRFRHRLAGWYGGEKRTRFDMDSRFRPTPGAGGYQLSNPSAADLASLSAALSVFARTSMRALRSKALVLTAYAQHLLDGMLDDAEAAAAVAAAAASASAPAAAAPAAAAPVPAPFRVITPRDPRQRGAQLSVLLADGLLEDVGRALAEAGVVCDRRKPDVVRVAPVPLYCTFSDVYNFMRIFRAALGLQVPGQALLASQVGQRDGTW